MNATLTNMRGTTVRKNTNRELFPPPPGSPFVTPLLRVFYAADAGQCGGESPAKIGFVTPVIEVSAGTVLRGVIMRCMEPCAFPLFPEIIAPCRNCRKSGLVRGDVFLFTVDPAFLRFKGGGFTI